MNEINPAISFLTHQLLKNWAHHTFIIFPPYCIVPSCATVKNNHPITGKGFLFAMGSFYTRTVWPPPSSCCWPARKMPVIIVHCSSFLQFTIGRRLNKNLFLLFEIFLVEGMMYKMDEFVSNFPVH